MYLLAINQNSEIQPSAVESQEVPLSTVESPEVPLSTVESQEVPLSTVELQELEDEKEKRSQFFFPVIGITAAVICMILLFLFTNKLSKKAETKQQSEGLPTSSKPQENSSSKPITKNEMKIHQFFPVLKVDEKNKLQSIEPYHILYHQSRINTRADQITSGFIIPVIPEGQKIDQKLKKAIKDWYTQSKNNLQFEENGLRKEDKIYIYDQGTRIELTAKKNYCCVLTQKKNQFKFDSTIMISKLNFRPEMHCNSISMRSYIYNGLLYIEYLETGKWLLMQPQDLIDIINSNNIDVFNEIQKNPHNDSCDPIFFLVKNGKITQLQQEDTEKHLKITKKLINIQTWSSDTKFLHSIFKEEIEERKKDPNCSEEWNDLNKLLDDIRKEEEEEMKNSTAVQ